MKLLIMSGPLFPKIGNNANLVGKLIPYLLEKNHEVRWFSSAFGVNQNKPSNKIMETQVYWCHDKKDINRTVIYPLISKIKDPNGFSDELLVQVYTRELKRIRNEYPFDAVISTSEPYAMGAAASRLKDIRKILYLMDPPALVSNGHNTRYRTSSFGKVSVSQDAIISTPFIFDALKKYGIELSEDKCIQTGFPMIQRKEQISAYQQKEKIKLLFTGWLYSDIRSPKYFLDVVAQLDKRFQVTFMGNECEHLKQRFPVESIAEIISIPQQPYEVALQAMADTDILINIGNSVPVHMPSKILEYINTGKPMVNFYKFDNCPTLYYTKRYPLALNLSESDQDIESVTKRFTLFCEESKGKTVNREYILNEYKDCTAEYIAEKLLEALEK